MSNTNPGLHPVSERMKVGLTVRPLCLGRSYIVYDKPLNISSTLLLQTGQLSLYIPQHGL